MTPILPGVGAVGPVRPPARHRQARATDRRLLAGYRADRRNLWTLASLAPLVRARVLVGRPTLVAWVLGDRRVAVAAPAVGPRGVARGFAVARVALGIEQAPREPLAHAGTLARGGARQRVADVHVATAAPTRRCLGRFVRWGRRFVARWDSMLDGNCLPWNLSSARHAAAYAPFSSSLRVLVWNTSWSPLTSRVLKNDSYPFASRHSHSRGLACIPPALICDKKSSP